MFTPEFVKPEDGAYVLLAAHFVENEKSAQLSIEYNLARIRFSASHLPPHITKCILVYDVRGQRVPDTVAAQIRESFRHIHELRFMR